MSVLSARRDKTKFWKEKHKTECFYVINILRDNKRAEMAGWCEGKLFLFLNLEIKVFLFISVLICKLETLFMKVNQNENRKHKKIAASIETFYSKTICQNLTSAKKMFFGSEKNLSAYRN